MIRGRCARAVADVDSAEPTRFMGHSDLQMVQRYTKLLPQPEEQDPAERLKAYLAKRRRRRAD
jgi:hypothetical protein